LVLVALAAAFFCAWSAWQIQQSEARIKAQEASIREKAILVGELADEISLASSYLYEAMDRHLLEIEKLRQEWLESREATVASVVDEPDADNAYGWVFPAEEAVRSPGVSVEATTAYDPHFQALSLAAQGADLVEIARHTDLGVEELRLLRFQQELSMAE
jgi:hypothetical protein